jgi:hypothetical protein
VALAYDLATGKEVARNVASGTPKTFSLNVDPGDYYLMFIENEGTPTQRSFAFQNITGRNVFTFKANTTLDLGVLVFDKLSGTAKPQIDRISGNGNVTESSALEASFSPGAGEWIETRKFVNSTCSGHSPGTTVTGNVTIRHGFGIVTYTPAGTTETAIGVANVNTAILTASAGALETIYLTMQSDNSLAGTYSKVGYGGGCSEEGTLTAVLSTSPPLPPPAASLTGLSINGPSSMSANSTATYTATAAWSDNSTSTVTPTWGVNSYVASISPDGVLSCNKTIVYNEPATVTATYSAGGITKTATMDVTITNETQADKTLTRLYILGPSVMNKYGTATYIAMADFSDRSTSTVTPTWSVNSQVASISAGGVLSCQTIDTDLTVTVSATYSAGGSAKTAAKDVTIANKPTFPFRTSMLSGRMYFEENISAGGDYDSSLFKFNDDSSFHQYRYKNPPGTSEYVNGTWSIGASGEAILNYGAGKTITVMRLDELFMAGQVLVDEGTGTPHIVTWKWAGPGPFPFDSYLLPGTYVNQYGDTWIFNYNWTGSTTGSGGWTFTWGVDAGILKVFFPNGYVGWMYQTPSANTWTSYPEIAWAFVLNTPTGDFYFYYGGMKLTRQ